MSDLSRPGLHLLTLLGYSALLILFGGRWFGDAVGVHWFCILLHAATLCVAGVLALRGTASRARAKGYFLSMLLVLLIGHGLCFFNGLVNFDMH
ncbi:MAG: hypothetical protein JNM62_10615 [Flavobacteriales bacterium]|nr:hypothetical protein [Flavobacteriales bacterium]